MLEQLLAQAKKGEVLGLAFMVRLGSKHHGMGVTGEYLADPLLGVAAASRMIFRLNRLAEAREQDAWVGKNM